MWILEWQDALYLYLLQKGLTRVCLSNGIQGMSHEQWSECQNSTVNKENILRVDCFCNMVPGMPIYLRGNI